MGFMLRTMVSPYVYSEDEYNIAALLSNRARRRVTILQDRLKRVLGDVIWLMPANCLHVTLMEIICDTECRDLSRAEHFKLWHKKYSKPTRAAIGSFSPFDVTFNEVVVSQGAIIIKSPDSKPFNDIRNRLLSEVELPEGTKMPPDIAHCTIARYATALDLNDVRYQTSGLEIDLTERITQFSLIKDMVPPDFNPTVIETYGLLGTTEDH